MDQTLNWSDCLAHVEMSDVGMRRANNQDSMAVLMPVPPNVMASAVVINDAMDRIAAAATKVRMRMNSSFKPSVGS